MDLLRSLPLGLYLEQPITWLHRLESTAEVGMVDDVLAAPLLANSFWRLLLATLLVVLTVLALIPLRVWRQQMGWLLVLSFMVFALTTILPDGLKTRHQPRLPVNELAFAQQSNTLPPAPGHFPGITRWAWASPPHHRLRVPPAWRYPSRQTTATSSSKVAGLRSPSDRSI